MVRFRLSGDGPSTFEGSVAGESVLVVDRWSSGKGLALTSSRENAILSIRFAFALSVRPRVSPTTCLGARVGSFGEAPALSSDCTRDIRRDAVNSPQLLQPLARSRHARRSSSGATSMLGLFFSTSAPTVALAPAKEGQALPVLVRRLGAYAVTARRGRGWEEFGPLEPTPHQPETDPPPHRTLQPKHRATFDQIPLAGTRFRTMARVGLTPSPALAGAGFPQ